MTQPIQSRALAVAIVIFQVVSPLFVGLSVA